VAQSNIVAVLIVRCTHTGVYANGRPNTASVTLYDLDEITIQKNRTRAVPVPPGGFVDIPMSTRTFVSYHEGAICKHVANGEITAEIILQLREAGNCGGPAGTGQALRPAVLNVERVANELRLVIPDNVIPTNLDSVGFLRGEPVTITGFTGVFRNLDGEYIIEEVSPSEGLAGPQAGSYLVVVPSEGADIAAATLSGVNLCLSSECGGGRVVAQFNSGGDTGGLGSDVYGYIGGQLFPNAGGGGGAPDNATYVTMSLNATLTQERVLTAGTGISIVDGGANNPVTLNVDATLAEILASGNATGGTNILISTGDSIVGQTDLTLTPGAAPGDNIILDGLTWPGADGLAGQALITNGLGILSFGNPTPAFHAPTHIHLGADEIDGDKLDIDFVPVNYVRTIVGPWTTSVEELTSHLKGIDDALATASGDTSILQWGNENVGNSTATRYLDPGFEQRLAPLVTGVVQLRVPRAGTLRNLYIRHNNPGGTGAIVTYTVRINGVGTALSVGLATTGANAQDVVNSVVVAAGDRVDIEVTKVALAGGTSIVPEATVEVAA